MKILITVSDIVWGGKHTYMYRAGAALQAAGHDVLFCGEADGDLISRLTREGLPSLAVIDFEGAQAEAERVIAGKLRDGAMDLVIATGRRDYRVAARAIEAAQPKVKFVLVRLSGFPFELTPEYVAILIRADAILLLTNRIIDQQFLPLVAEGVLVREKFIEFRTTVDTARFTPRDPSPEILRQLGLSPADRVIASVARLSWEKGHPTLLRAFAEIPDRGHDLKLLLVGEGQMRRELMELATNLEIASQVIFTGQREDIPELLSISHIHVLASICEETGAISLQEAMAMGVPVIASRAGVIPDYVRHLDTGLLFTPGDPRDLATCLVRLLGNPGLRQELAERARREIVDRFDEAAQMRRLDRFLRDLVGVRDIIIGDQAALDRPAQ
jgi:glycosyltransferase involved in cell wall biosynthesis